MMHGSRVAKIFFGPNKQKGLSPFPEQAYILSVHYMNAATFHCSNLFQSARPQIHQVLPSICTKLALEHAILSIFS